MLQLCVFFAVLFSMYSVTVSLETIPLTRAIVAS